MAKQSADIVFVLDASKSMEPCINAVKENIVDFTKVFQDDPNNMWDIRLDFLAHKDKTLENRSNESGIDKDFKERVVAAGGQYEGVDFRASLKWHNTDDLDLHVQTPFGETPVSGLSSVRPKADKSRAASTIICSLYASNEINN